MKKGVRFPADAFYLIQLVVLSEPLIGVGSGHALDAFFRILGLCAAEGVEEELAALGLVEGLFVAGRIAEVADGLLGNQLRSFGIVLDLADNLLHSGGFPFFFTHAGAGPMR